MVNLSFSFRTPSTSSYLLVGVNEREDRRLPTVETRTHRWVVFFGFPVTKGIENQKEEDNRKIAWSFAYLWIIRENIFIIPWFSRGSNPKIG